MQKSMFIRNGTEITFFLFELKLHFFLMFEEGGLEKISDLGSVQRTICSCHFNICPSEAGFGTNLCFLFYQKKGTLLKKKMQFCVCFLKMFRPLKGWYVLL